MRVPVRGSTNGRLFRSVAVSAVGLSALAALSGCHVGLDKKDAHAAADKAVTAPVVNESGKSATLKPDPIAPTGQASIDGSTRGSLTAAAVAQYDRSGGAAEVTVGDNGANSAFASLCRGGIDMVDSARSISASELDSCREHGLQVVQFQFASDAVVLAIKSETDVGGDCLTLSQVNNIYRAGSPVINWSDVGFDNVPIQVGGPDRSNNAFDFFGRNVLGAPEPSMTYLRSDYQAFADDAATRLFVIGSPLANGEAQLADHYAQLLGSKRGVVIQDASNLADAKATTLAALRNRRKGIIDNRPQKTQRQDQARLVAARQAQAAAQSEYTRQHRAYVTLSAPAHASASAATSVAALRGRVAYFRFTYYELFEDDLRPFEISARAKPRNCIFPSEATISSGTYPLARRLLVTTTTRSLGRHEVEDFLLHYLTVAQADATSARLLPISDDVVAQEKAWLLGTEQPRVLTPSDLSAQPDDVEPAQ